MTEHAPDTAEPDVTTIYDTSSSAWLTCLVCGSLVSREGEYARAHWDWHEASNGA